MTRGEAWYKWCPAAHFYFFYFFYFDLDGHFSLTCILNIYGVYFYILFFFVPHGTACLHHPVSVRNANPAQEAIHYASDIRSRS